MNGAGVLQRRLVLCVLAAGVLVTALMAWLDATNRGYFPLVLRPGFSSMTFSAVVAPGSEAMKAGLRTGDVVDLRAMVPSDRFQLFWSTEKNARIVLAVRRGPRLLQLPLAARPRTVSRSFLIALLSDVWMMLGAFVLVWRGWTNELARRLALILAGCGFTDPFFYGNACTGSPLIDFALAVTLGACFASLGALAIAWTLRFFGPANSVERSLFVSLILIQPAFIAGESLAALNAWFAFTDLNAWWIWPNGIWEVLLCVSCLTFILLFAMRIHSVRGPARTRLVWLAFAIGPWLISMLVAGIMAFFSPVSLQLWENAAFIWMPIGLTYGAFGRRLLDVGFVINRVAVYTGVSLVIVAIFVLAEYLLTDVLSASRNENLLIGAAVALSLGLSMRFIHHYVDRFLDNVFFRKRHENEQALRVFAHEASFMSDPHIVLDRARATIEQRTDASRVDFALHDGNGCYGEVDENDPAIVSLRAWRKPLDLHGIDSQLQGEFAFPMFARGRMVGVLAIGAKRSGEPYAPDESAAIAELARGVGLAVDTLMAQRTDRAEMIADIKEAVTQALAGRAAATQ